MKHKTHNEFIDELHKISPEIEVLSKYESTHTKVRVKCGKCGNEWFSSPANLLHGYRCRKCWNAICGLPKRLSNEEFVKRVKIANPSIELLSSYVKTGIKVQAKCKQCGLVWMANPVHLSRGHGCPRCSAIKRGIQHRTKNEDFIALLSNRNPTIIPKTDYVTSATKMLVSCSVCGNEWEATPSSLLGGEGCPLCGREKTRKALLKPKEEFIQELRMINPSIEVLGDYVDTKTKITVMHTTCGFVWDVVPNSLLCGHGCPRCIESIGEIETAKCLERHGIEFIRQKRFSDCRCKLPLAFDFYLPNLNACVEFDGKQHFQAVEKFGGESGFKEQQKRDRKKTSYCKSRGIKLVRIKVGDNIENVLAEAFGW